MREFTAEVFANEETNRYVAGLMRQLSGRRFMLHEAVKYGMGKISHGPRADVPLSAFFFCLSEAPGLDRDVRSFLLDLSVWCEEGEQDRSGYFRHFDPVKAYKKIAPRLEPAV